VHRPAKAITTPTLELKIDFSDWVFMLSFLFSLLYLTAV